MSNLFKETIRILGTHHSGTFSYHPQTNGLCERVNGILVNSIEKYVRDNQQNWAFQHPLVVFAYNCSKYSSTGFSPFYLLYKEMPVFPSDLNIGNVPNVYRDKHQYLKAIMDVRPRVREKVVPAINKASERQAMNYDKKRRAVDYQVGGSVLVFSPIRKVGSSEKLISLYLGPYVVDQKASDVSYLIRDPRSGKKEFVHVSRMKLYWDRQPLMEVEPHLPMIPDSQPSQRLPEFRQTLI